MFADELATNVWFGWQREQVAATAIEKLDGKVGWKPVVPDTFLEWIPQSLHIYCNRIIKVNWTGKPITDASLVHIVGLVRLQWLDLSDTKVTDAGMVRLQGLAQLKTLYLHHTQVTSAGLEYLQELTQLEILRLVRTQVDDGGLVYLENLSNLKCVSLGSTQVTDAAVAKLHKALPNCRIGR